MTAFAGTRPPTSIARSGRRSDRRVASLRSAEPSKIAARLEELDREWDIERVLGLMSSALSIFGLTMGLRRRRWLLLPLVVQSFFLQHATQGWCPPLPLLRAQGFRSPSRRSSASATPFARCSGIASTKA